MLVVRTSLRHSPIHGLGCYADEDIKVGQVVWELSEGIDLEFSEEDLKKFPKSFIEFLKIYAYSPMNETEKKYVLCIDHARHMNHSEHPNLFETPDGKNIAARDIKIGEELTCDYSQYDKDYLLKLS